MCTRFLLEGAAAKAGFAKLGLDALAAAVDAATNRFNIAPGTELLALRAGEKPRTARVFTPRWGFAPSAASSSAPGSPLTNARAETLAQKPTFRNAFLRRRCLVPATGFYEWEKRGRARLPWLFRRVHDEPFCFAGLWEPEPDDGRAPATVVLVTTAPNALMAPLHHRMPALLPDPAACRAWLDPRSDPAALHALLAPPDAATMTATPVSPKMNRSDFDSPDCVRPAVHGLAARDEDDGDNLGLGL